MKSHVVEWILTVIVIVVPLAAAVYCIPSEAQTHMLVAQVGGQAIGGLTEVRMLTRVRLALFLVIFVCDCVQFPRAHHLLARSFDSAALPDQ